MAAVLDRLLVPAAFVDMLAAMPPVTAPLPVRLAWCDDTVSRLRSAFWSGHGMEAMRMLKAVCLERDAVQTALAAESAGDLPAAA